MLSRARSPFFNASLVLLVSFALARPGFASPQAAAGAATAPTAVTAPDYARAEKFLAAGVNPLVIGGSVTAAWLQDDRFTYRNTTCPSPSIRATISVALRRRVRPSPSTPAPSTG